MTLHAQSDDLIGDKYKRTAGYYVQYNAEFKYRIDHLFVN